MGYLVTGGAGFIGRRVVERLLADDERVIVLDRQPAPEGMERVRWICGDVADAHDVLSAVEGERPRFVIHTAFAMERADYRPPSAASPLTGAGREMVGETNLGLALRVNCGGMLNILDAARLFEVERVVYTSAVAAFGSDIATRHPAPIDDDAVFAPDSMYGATKLLNEVMARLHRDRFGIDSIGFRIARTFGLGNPAPFTDFLRRVAIGEEVDLTDPDYFNSYLFVDDCADALIHACTVPEPPGAVFNLREGEYSNRDLVAAIGRVHPHAKVRLVDGDSDGVRVPRMTDGGVAEQLGWRAPHSLDAALTQVFDAFRAQAGLPSLARQTGLPALSQSA